MQNFLYTKFHIVVQIYSSIGNFIKIPNDCTSVDEILRSESNKVKLAYKCSNIQREHYGEYIPTDLFRHILFYLEMKPIVVQREFKK